MVESFVSFPNARSFLVDKQVVYTKHYASLEHIIHILYRANFTNSHIRNVYTAFHESEYLLNCLHNVCVCIIQVGVNEVYVLTNRHYPLTERAMYIRMHDFTNGKRVQCNQVKSAICMTSLGLFAILGIVISLVRAIELISYSNGGE